MADEQYGWLDEDAAERLLRGEPLDAIDPDTRAHAARVTEALAALAGPPTPTGVELPGETAALAAFRAVRTSGNAEGAALGRPTGPEPAALPQALDFARAGGTPLVDAGLVRLGRPVPGGRRVRWGRPVRLGLAAAAAVGMIGGVAVAAGTGVLPTPFGDEPGPAASVSAAATPPPLVTATPGGPETGGSPSPTSGATTGAPAGSGSFEDEAGGGSDTTGRPGSGGDRADGRTRAWWTEVRSSCRDMASGRQLGAERMRSLEGAAGGSGRVKAFCKDVLGGGEDRAGTGGDKGQNGNGQNGNGQNGNGQNGNGQNGNGQNGNGQDGNGQDGNGEGRNPQGHDSRGNGEDDPGGDGGDGESHQRPGRDDATATPSDSPQALASLPSATEESPSPTYGDSASSMPSGQ
ncbi:hypothetical protein [Streptomyces colonosanans]|uniref:Extensin n=1 Tax=Streptomyces colonosanans TaxID=1428652 RepID=A0A1S2PCA1_9ACTN|nr:hypothetical protein [Streptomyces colonosanans]OIJ91226.1 hypothetical protein BIV24_16735 [Streptomyces colonosanans]